VVNVDWSYPVVSSLGYHMCIVAHTLISLWCPVSIGQDEVETITSTILHVIFNPKKPEAFSLLNGLNYPVLAWEHNFFGATKETWFGFNSFVWKPRALNSSNNILGLF
jgi:hypothetical protein